VNILRSQRDTDEEDFSAEQTIEQEFGWLHESGIYLEEIHNFSRERIRK
jgi:hypothetical protein